MAFLKINRFAGILAIACACFFNLDNASALSVCNVIPGSPNGAFCNEGGEYQRIRNNSYFARFNGVNTGGNVSINGPLPNPSKYGEGVTSISTLYTVGENLTCNGTGPSNGSVELFCNYKGKQFILQGINDSSGFTDVIIAPFFGTASYEYLPNYGDFFYAYENTVGFVENSNTNRFGLICNLGSQCNLSFEVNTTILPFGPEPPPPPPPPAEIAINGLNCTTDIIPDIENATWYNNFMNNTGFLSNVDDDGWIRFFSWSGTIYNFPEAQYVNRAALYYTDQTAGGVFASGSLNYPGTERTTTRGGNKSPLLLSFSDSEVKPNVVQWHGVNSVALGYAGTVQFQNTQLQDSPEVPISASGGIATAVISGNERINKVLLNYSSGFNGFRYGVAPTTSKSSCSYKYNLCEWSIEGANTVCQSGNLVGGIPAGNCVITGSGSVYGSGACVPETNGSGAIIPPVMVPGITVYDSNGNPVGNIYENESAIPDLSCDYSTTDGWTDKIGKTFQCVTSFFSSSAKLSKDGVSGITGASQQLGESIKQDIGTNTGTTATGSSNMLLNSLYGVDEGVKEYKYVKLSYALLIFTITVFLIVMLSIVLKSGISNIKN